MTTETLRPNAAGDLTNWPTQFPNSGAHYEKVDDASPDEDTTYIATQSNGATTKDDLYNIPDSAIPDDATINSVTVWIRIRNTDGGAAMQPGSGKCMIKTGGTQYASPVNQPGDSYTNYSYAWNINPKTGLAWVKADINALQIGVRGNSGVNDLELPSAWFPVRCTQVYVVIDYTEAGGPAQANLVQVI